MSRLRSEQSRTLRRRLLLHTLSSWVVFTVAFIMAALAANAYLVPNLANYIADTTGTTLYYDPETYLQENTFTQLMNRYVQISEENLENNSTFEIMANDAPAIDRAVLDAISAALDAEADEGATVEETTSSFQRDILAEAHDEALAVDGVDGASATSATSEASRSLETVIHTVSVEQLEQARTKALGEGWRDAPIGEGVTYLSDNIGNIVDEYYGQYTPRMLAHAAALDDFTEMREKDPNQNWQIAYVPSSRDDGLGAFEARELSTYKALKVFKVPVAILLYLVGCLVVVMVELGRSLRYFDELSGAVAGLMTDRTHPVELPPSLAIAQGELNRIRMESLADERAAAVAEQRKNELVAYLAHDIRTPLTSVIGYLSLMDEAPDLPAEQRRHFVRTAFAKAERLETLIDEFFEITRYNLQSIPIERSTVEVRLFLEQIADEFFPQASEKDVRISVEAPAEQTFFVDGERLARAVGNVVRNAVAYADKSTAVMLAAQPDSQDEQPGRWRLTVTDHGREISPMHLETIFEKFYREDDARGAKAGGAGLGLAIAKEIITAHEGTITAKSERGQTTFTIII